LIWIALTIAAAVAVGVAAERRTGVRAGDAARRLMRVMLYVLLPPVVFFNLAHLHVDADVGAGLVLGWVVVVGSGLLAYAVARGALHLDRPQTGALINATLHPNTGYLGLPLCAAALGTDSLDQAVAYDVLVGTPTLLLGVFAVGAAFGTRGGETVRDRVRVFFTRNPPLIAAIAGLLAPEALAPDVLVDASRVVVFALLPLGFFAVGVTLAEDAQGRVRVPPPLTPRLVAALVLRLVVAPLLLLALAAPLIDLPDPYLILAAMPAGLNGLVVAHEYGLDLGFAAGAITWGTVIVVATALAVTIIA
jgi:predicted permease